MASEPTIFASVNSSFEWFFKLLPRSLLAM
jgi:hypothetical protein